MKQILTSTLPVMIFAGSLLLIYTLHLRLWTKWIYRKIRKKDTGNLLTSRGACCLHIVGGIGIICMLYGFLIEPYWLQVNIIPIYTDKLDHTIFRVVQVSDIHCDKNIRLETRLPDIINDLDPDIIVFTGDSINCDSALPLFQDTLSKLNAPLGKFAVTGNWDYAFWSDLDLFVNTGFEELRMDQKMLEKGDESIVIAGVAYEDAENSQKVIGHLDTENFNLLLYHNSVLMDYFGDKNVDLYLCGHTHGGQIALPFYGAMTTLSRHGKKFEAGLYKERRVQLYVNRGVGLEGGLSPKARFLARPEIAVFDIGPESKRETKE